MNRRTGNSRAKNQQLWRPKSTVSSPDFHTPFGTDVSSGGSISSTSNEKSSNSGTTAGYPSGGGIRQSVTPTRRQGQGWSTFSSETGSRGGSARQSTTSSRGSNASNISRDAQYELKSDPLSSGVKHVKENSSDTIKGSSNVGTGCSAVNLDRLFMKSLVHSPDVARGGSARQSTTSSRGSNASNISRNAQYELKSDPLSSGVKHVKENSSDTIKGSSNVGTDCSAVNLDPLFMASLVHSPDVAQLSPDSAPVKSCSEAKMPACSVSLPENENSEYRVQKFDICRPQNSGVVKLKPGLHSTNKEKRKEKELFISGPQVKILRSGMVLLKNYLTISEQASIIEICRQHGQETTGFYQPCFGENGKMHLKLMCFGAFWDPVTNEYAEVRPMDLAKPPPIPQKFLKLVARSVNDAHSIISENPKVKDVESILPSVQPDICLVNFYPPKTGRLGLHQDKDESPRSLHNRIPIVSFSIGDSAEFVYSDYRDAENANKEILESGDVLIFGGKSRHIFHGVTTVIPETAPKSLVNETNFRPGRLNLTFRQRF